MSEFYKLLKIFGLREFAKKIEEIQPMEWLEVEGFIPVGQPGSGTHVPGFIETIERFKYILGCDEPNFKEFFIFGKKLRGRYVARKVLLPVQPPDRKARVRGKLYRWVFWRTKDQRRFKQLQRLLGKTGELFEWALPFDWEERKERDGVIVFGEAIHVGPAGVLNGKRKIYLEEELIRGARTLINVPIRVDQHETGKIVGTVIDSEYNKEKQAVEYTGHIWDKRTIQEIREGKIKNVSIGAYYRGIPKEVNGLALPRITFYELLLIREGEALPGDPKAFVKLLVGSSS